MQGVLRQNYLFHGDHFPTNASLLLHLRKIWKPNRVITLSQEFSTIFKQCTPYEKLKKNFVPATTNLQVNKHVDKVGWWSVAYPLKGTTV